MPAPHQRDSELARVVDAWPELPAAIRSAILAMVDAAGNSSG